MAFQATAFQSNAFQISASQIDAEVDVGLQRRKARRIEEIKARKLYEEALVILKEAEKVVEVEEYKEQLKEIIEPFKKEKLVFIGALLEQEQAKLQFEQILILIRRLEDELLEMLALLLLANEAL